MKTIKQLTALALLCCLCLTLAASTLGAPGAEDDPVVSVSYLEKVWAKELFADCEAQLKQQLSGVYADSLARLSQSLAEQNRAAYAAAGKRRAQGSLVLKMGDVLLPEPGCKLMLYDGALTAEPSLIDVTTAQPAGAALTARHLYMQGAQASAGLTVQTLAAELWLDGVYAAQPSAGTDYGAIAQALEKLGLFRGMTEGYGLLSTTTRAQGLTMFLRLMGLEKEALACTAPIPFKDVPSTHWAYPYVAYAYTKGLTNGTAADKFSPDAPVTAQHYVTFLLRAQHYEEGTAFTYETALRAAVEHGVFTQAELDSFPGGLTRCGLVYLSYYSLYGRDAETGSTVLETLLNKGTITAQTLAAALLTVRSPRRT